MSKNQSDIRDQTDSTDQSKLRFRFGYVLIGLSGVLWFSLFAIPWFPLSTAGKATAFYEDDDAQYRVSYKSELSGQGEGYDVKNIKAKAKATKKGYLVEMAIKIKNTELKPDAKLGLELQVNDNSGDATRAAVAKWHHTEDDSWESTSDFGTLLIK